MLIFSFCNAAMRFVGGSLSDVSQKHFAPRLGGRMLIVVPSALLMCLAAVLLLIDRKKTGMPLIAAAIGGCSEGLFFGVWFTTMRETFGPRYYGTNMSIMLSSFAIGTTFYLKGLAAINKDAPDRDGKLRPVLIGIIVLTAIASVLAFSLFLRPRRLFRSSAGLS